MAKKWRREGGSLAKIVRTDLRRRAHHAADRATRYAKEQTQQRIRGAGLGRLANAVGSTSSFRERGYVATDNAWGAVFARGKTEGRGNQALLAYSEGATIMPRGGKKWMAFATDAIPKRAGRYKMTPARYNASGLVQSIGKLVFVMGKSGRVAYLVARNVVQSKRTGRIKAPGARTPRGAVAKKSVVAFVLIKITRRGQRFNQPAIMRDAAAQIPRFAAEFNAG